MTAIDVLTREPLARQVGWVLVHFVWQGAATAGLLWLVLEALRRQTARARYLAACVAMGLMAAAPVVTFALLPSPGAAAGGVSADAPPANVVQPVAGTALAQRTVAHAPAPTGTVTRAHPPRGEASSAAKAATADTTVRWRESIRGRLEPALPWCVAAWLAGVVLLSVWHLAAWGKVRRLRTSGTAAAGEVLQAAARRLVAALRIHWPVRLVESVRATAPMVIGWLRPVVLLPVSATTGLTAEQIEAILAHELAHIRRCDFLVNLVQSVVETLLFYHPAVWWVSRRVRTEREHCCDDVAVEACGDRSGYAGALAALAEHAAASRAPVAAGGGRLLARIRRVLMPRACHAGGARTCAAAILVAGLLAMGVFWAMVATAGGPGAVTQPGASAPGTGPGGADDVKVVLPILRSLKQEMMGISTGHPELAEAKAVEATLDGWLFEQDCRDMGKRGYENTGPFPIAIGLRVMTVAQFRAQADKVEMRFPGHRWDYLGLVGWTTLHTGPDIPGALAGKLQDALKNALAEMGRLNRQALAARLPRAIQERRDRLLAEADAAIRKGVQRLADKYPLLKKGGPWRHLESPSDPGRIGIHLRRQQGGKSGTDAQEFPPSEAFIILVVIQPPPDEIEQLVQGPLYQHLGLVGAVGARAANPQLDAELKKLVSDALAPLTELERQASALPAPSAARAAGDPMEPTPATLGKWLAGKEVVEVCFAGAHREPLKLRDSLKIQVADNDWDFRLMPGEGGGANRSFVEVCMKASPENTRRLLALQEELEPRGYRLDPEHTRVWSLAGDPNARAKAREMAPEVLAAAAKAIRTALPKAQSNPERPGRATYLAGIRYEVPGTSTSGMIRISEIAATKAWQLAVAPEQVTHLPRLGLMITAYYRPGRDTTSDASPERAAIRKAVSEAIAPLLKLEGDTARLHEQPLPPSARPAPAPAVRDLSPQATRPVGIQGNPRIRRDGNVITLAQDATDADLAALRDVRGIAELRMGGGPVGGAGPYVTDAGLAILSGWTDLKVLHLPGLPVHDRLRYPNVTHFTDAGLAHLRGLAKLEKLVLVDQEITDEGLASLSGLTELRELWLDFIPLSDAGLRHLTDLRKLQVLRLYGAGITDKGLRYLVGMDDMRDLQLGRARVTDRGLATVIARMRKLDTLDLQGNPISNDGLSALANLTDLQWLALSNTPITDVGLKQVAKLHKLEYLFLDGADITDAGLTELAGLKQLKRLKVEETSVTAEGIRKLKLSLPGLEAVASAQVATRPAAADQTVEARIAGLIGQLDSGRYAEREAAQKALVAIGRPAIRALEAAGGGRNAEGAARARTALRQIRERFALTKETWRNRWERVSVSFRLTSPSGRDGSMGLDIDPNGKATAELWEPRREKLARYESVLGREDLDRVARQLGQQQPWELSDAPKLPPGRGGTISLTITVEDRSVHVEQPWPPPKDWPRTRENERIISALMATQNAMNSLIGVVRRDATIRTQGGTVPGGMEGKAATAEPGGERTAIRKVLDLLDLPWQTKLSDAELDEAAASIRAQADPAVEALMERYNQKSSNSFRHRAVQVFQRLATPKARAALLDIALGRAADKLPSWHAWAARAYLEIIPDKADARELLASDESGVLNAALLAIKGLPVDEALLKRLGQIIQRKAEHPADWSALRMAAADVVAADPQPVLLAERVDLILTVLHDVAGMPEGDKTYWHSSMTYGETAYSTLLRILSEVPAEAAPLLAKASAGRDGAERDILIVARALRGDAAVRKDIHAILGDAKAGLRRAWAARALGVIGTAEDLPLLKRLAETDPLARERGGDIGPPGFRQAKFYPVRDAAKEAIQALEPKAAPAATQPATRPATGPSSLPAETSWSQGVNGLQARLALRRTEVNNGTPIISTFLELRNVSERGDPVKLAWRSECLRPRVIDGNGHELPTAKGPYDGPDPGARNLVIPRGGALSVDISRRGLGIGADEAGLIDLGPSHSWVFQTSTKGYYLQAVLEVPKPKQDHDETGWNWHGRIELPPVRVPLGPEPPDPATVGPRIEQLGRKMMDKPGSAASEEAARALSLLDDRRVIPWYLKAMDTDSYQLKFAAIDRLSRLRGDEALEGLKKGMKQTNTNLRLAAAQGLARSPHPNARTLLLSMRNDSCLGVRITVLQTFGRHGTAESRKLLEEMMRDSNKTVRDEARRHLDLLQATEAELARLAEVLRKAVGGDWKVRQEEEGIGPILAGLDNSVMVFPFPFDKAGQQRFRRFQAMYADPFCVYGADGRCTVASGPGGAREDILAALGLSRAALAQAAAKVRAAHPAGGKAMWQALAARVRPGMTVPQMKVLLPPARPRQADRPQEVLILDGAHFTITYPLDGAWGVQASGIAQGQSQDHWVLDAAPWLEPRRDLPTVTIRPAAQPAFDWNRVWERVLAACAGMEKDHPSVAAFRVGARADQGNKEIAAWKYESNVELDYGREVTGRRKDPGGPYYHVRLSIRPSRTRGFWDLASANPSIAWDGKSSERVYGIPWLNTAIGVTVLSDDADFVKAINAILDQEVSRALWRSAPSASPGIRNVGDVLASFRAALVRLSAEHAELAGAGDVAVDPNGVSYSRNCRFMGKRGYEDTGPKAVAIAIEVMPGERYRQKVQKVAMQMPGHRWDRLGLVGWATLHLGKDIPPALSAKLTALLERHLAMIDELDRRAPGAATQPAGAAPASRPLSRRQTADIRAEVAAAFAKAAAEHARGFGKLQPAPDGRSEVAWSLICHDDTKTGGKALNRSAAMDALVAKMAGPAAKGAGAQVDKYVQAAGSFLSHDQAPYRAVACELLYRFPREMVELGLVPTVGGLLDDHTVAFEGADIMLRSVGPAKVTPGVKLTVAEIAQRALSAATSCVLPNGKVFQTWWRHNSDYRRRLWYWALRWRAVKPESDLAGLADLEPREALKILLLAGNNPAGRRESLLGFPPPEELRKLPFPKAERPEPAYHLQTGPKPATIADFVRKHSLKPVLMEILRQTISWPEVAGSEEMGTLLHQAVPVMALAFDESDAAEVRKVLAGLSSELKRYHGVEAQLGALAAGLTARPGAGNSNEEADCQRLYEQYKTLILPAVKAGDRDKVARLTDAFNASIGGRLLYMRVSRIDAPDKVTALLNKPFGRRRVSLPNIHYAFSPKPHVTRQEDPAGAYMLVETNNLGGGKYADDVFITMALEPAPPGDRAAKALEELKRNLDTLVFTVTLSPPGEDPKNPKYKLRSLKLAVPALLLEPFARWPDGSPREAYARISREQALKAADALAQAGFFDRAGKYYSDRHDKAAQAAPPPADARPYAPPARKDAHAEVRLVSHDENWYTYFIAFLDWDASMLPLLDAVRGALDGEAAKAMDKLMAPLELRREEWQTVVKGKLAAVSVERVLYEKAGNAHFLVRVRITNLTDRPIGVDLRSKDSVIYPNQWGMLPTNARRAINERRITPRPVDEALRSRMLVAFRDKELTAVAPRGQTEYFREFNASGRKDIEKQQGSGKYLFVSMDGQLFVTDGQIAENINCFWGDGGAEKTDLILRLPIAWKKVPDLPAAETPLKEAIGRGFAFAAVCEATSDALGAMGRSGVFHARQSFKVLRILAGSAPGGKTVDLRYAYLAPPYFSQRAIRKGERVIWIVGKTEPPGAWSGIKPLEDTPDNRQTVLRLARSADEGETSGPPTTDPNAPLASAKRLLPKAGDDDYHITNEGAGVGHVLRGHDNALVLFPLGTSG